MSDDITRDFQELPSVDNNKKGKYQLTLHKENHVSNDIQQRYKEKFQCQPTLY